MKKKTIPIERNPAIPFNRCTKRHRLALHLKPPLCWQMETSRFLLSHPLCLSDPRPRIPGRGPGVNLMGDWKFRR